MKVESEPGWRRRRGRRVGLASAAGGRSRVGAEHSSPPLTCLFARSHEPAPVVRRSRPSIPSNDATSPARTDAPTDCRTSGFRTSRHDVVDAVRSSPASYDQSSTPLREAIMSSACPSHVFSGCSTSVSRSPCAAAEPERPPPAPRSTHAAPTASSTPASGPAT